MWEPVCEIPKFANSNSKFANLYISLRILWVHQGNHLRNDVFSKLHIQFCKMISKSANYAKNFPNLKFEFANLISARIPK